MSSTAAAEMGEGKGLRPDWDATDAAKLGVGPLTTESIEPHTPSESEAQRSQGTGNYKITQLQKSVTFCSTAGRGSRATHVIGVRGTAAVDNKACTVVQFVFGTTTRIAPGRYAVRSERTAHGVPSARRIPWRHCDMQCTPIFTSDESLHPLHEQAAAAWTLPQMPAAGSVGQLLVSSSNKVCVRHPAQ